ncbi:MAG: FtsX-like permease family protein [Gemmatimonadales bacterium]|nr:FtsX-like permease family protein [Gemmatimonadales bacterium]
MLDRKLLRDLWHLRGQWVGIAAVTACGVAVLVTTRTSYSSLLASRAAYYAEYRFAEVFLTLVRAPEGVAEKIRAVSGVAEVETRIVAPVMLDVPGLSDPASGRLISVPDQQRPSLNDLHLRRGRWVTPGRPDEIIVSEAFAIANRLELGQTIGAILNGRRQALRVVGIAISPEYVYEIHEGGLFPDNRRFGVLWMSRRALASAYDMVGAFNDLSLTLASGASPTEVIAAIDLETRRYGGLGAYARSDQMSARFLNDEIGQNRVSGTVIPAVFLAAAAFLLNVVLGRLVTTEREQIGTLKAFGFSHRTVSGHYLKLALAAITPGALVGIGAGLWLAAQVNARYAEFYRFPTFLFRVDGGAMALALLVTLVAALGGAAGAVRRVLRLQAATAMRAEAPPRFHAGILERLGLARLSLAGRMVARSLVRRPARALLSVLGVALAASILILGRYFIDAMQLMADIQFRHVQREDLTVVFTRPKTVDVRFELERLPGVEVAEPFRLVAARLVAGHRARRVALTGLANGSGLRRVVGRNLRSVEIPREGLLLTDKLAEVLAVGAGDTVMVESLEGRRRSAPAVVAGTVDELLGMSAYLDAGSLRRLLEDGPLATGAYLKVDPAEISVLHARLKLLPGVAAVSSRATAAASFDATLAKSLGLITGILIGFAGTLAVAMTYNTARIALAERGRELASLRVLGFSKKEVAVMLLGEQGVIAAAGIVSGLALGYWFCALLAGLYQWELFRLPFIVSLGTLSFAVSVVLGAAAASGLVIWHRLGRLDLVSVLKSRE